MQELRVTVDSGGELDHGGSGPVTVMQEPRVTADGGGYEAAASAVRTMPYLPGAEARTRIATRV